MELQKTQEIPNDRNNFVEPFPNPAVDFDESWPYNISNCMFSIPGQPSVYTNVEKFIPWIESVVFEDFE